MTNSTEDEPLDPAVEAIRVKMVRLLMVSGGIMMIGLMAVLAAIVYKIKQSDDAIPSSSAPSPEMSVTLPKGARLISTTPFERSTVLIIKKSDGSTLVQRLAVDGTVLSTITLIEE